MSGSLKCRSLKCRGRSNVGRSNVGALKCRGRSTGGRSSVGCSNVGAQMSGAQTSVNQEMAMSFMEILLQRCVALPLSCVKILIDLLVHDKIAEEGVTALCRLQKPPRTGAITDAPAF
ncbi:unnamed protein product [Didymodactylos carnosus]|uniref:Uncharacterized protein n=1 Tax=Didymodactylos carnosus TaxID=1234261 RepID=A0A8S2E200_9BILA|nr:unnamed protein product [Didymodactylos carnosus]CAF3812759.1 unnamed protein product [Didymodactylos carnosus]